jgi:hypothetical protein
MIAVYFKVPLFLVRLGGVPVGMRNVSKLNSLYNVLLAVCYYSTFLSVVIDFIIKKDDMVESMKNVRMIVGMVVVAWTHLYLR